VALLVLNVTAIVVGILVMADPPPTWLSVAWAGMHVIILGRMVLAAVSSGGSDPDTAYATVRGVPPADRELVAVGVARASLHGAGPVPVSPAPTNGSPEREEAR
jgi:cellulose synthase (UDP-forming)